MYLFRFLRRYRTDGTAYVLGGTIGILVFIIMAVFSIALIGGFALGTQNLASVISAVLVDLTNSSRGENDLGGLAINPTLSAAAQAKADDMATKSYFAHVSPEGVDSWYWFRQQGYTFLYAGENLAVDFSDSIDVERAWMNSPAHRGNILNNRFTEIGIATAQGTFQGHTTTFVVQMFGTPAPSTAPARVRTLSSPTEPTAPAFATTNVSESTSVTATNVAITPTVAREATNNLVLGTEASSILPVSASWWQHLLASPKTTLRYAFYGIAGAILILLALVTELEFHRRHMRHVIAVAFLFLLMAGLFVLVNFIFFAQPVVIALQ